ncbi:MAG: hypothetical protein ACRD96_00975, partial [Bryobacteraceae bacterium]
MGATPDPAAVRAELEAILASSGFAGAGRLSRFLRFAVEKTLAGEGADLKEYLIGLEVYGRKENFDPREDSIVRVEASRLRAKLGEYYDAAGRGAVVRIRLHKGGYL